MWNFLSNSDRLTHLYFGLEQFKFKGGPMCHSRLQRQVHHLGSAGGEWRKHVGLCWEGHFGCGGKVMNHYSFLWWFNEGYIFECLGCAHIVRNTLVKLVYLAVYIHLPRVR